MRCCVACYSASFQRPGGLRAWESVPLKGDYSFVGTSPRVKLQYPAVYSNEVKNEPSSRAWLAGQGPHFFIILRNANVFFFNMLVLQWKTVVACWGCLGWGGRHGPSCPARLPAVEQPRFMNRPNQMEPRLLLLPQKPKQKHGSPDICSWCASIT